MNPKSLVEIDGLWWPDYDRECRAVIPHLLDESIGFYLNLCRGRRAAIQAGGNVGLWPKALAKHFQRVTTFEPDPINYACLKQNLTETNVIAYHAALGAEHGRVAIQPVDANCGAAFVIPGDEVDALPLDALGLDDVDLIQLDIEGFEFEALRGAQATIERCSPTIVLELKEHGERYGVSDLEIVRWLWIHGYTIAGYVHRDVVFQK